jgi:hypothetical protein
VKAVSLKTDKEIRGLVIRFWTRSFFGMQTWLNKLWVVLNGILY